MSYVARVYDWRPELVPDDQMFRAGGASFSGGMTLSGATYEIPQPGGRSEVVLRFNTLKAAASAAMSWTLSRLGGGEAFRYRLCASPQLCPLPSGLGLGEPWAGGDPWASGENWAVRPTCSVVPGALEGQTRFRAYLGQFEGVLSIGHVIGFHIDGYDFAHMVMAVDTAVDGPAEIEITPPLRRGLGADDVMHFRPAMIVTCPDVRSVGAGFERRRYGSLGDIRLVEHLL